VPSPFFVLSLLSSLIGGFLSFLSGLSPFFAFAFLSFEGLARSSAGALPGSGYFSSSSTL